MVERLGAELQLGMFPWPYRLLVPWGRGQPDKGQNQGARLPESVGRPASLGICHC